MKNVLLICAGIIGFLALPVIYSTAKGYTTWFWRNPHAQVFVNGQRVPGYVHQSKRIIIVTRRETSKGHSYLIVLSEQFTPKILDCDVDWSAPPLPFFPMGHVNPPCLRVRFLGNTTIHNPPEAPIGPLKVDRTTTFEFHTEDGKLVRVLL